MWKLVSVTLEEAGKKTDLYGVIHPKLGASIRNDLSNFPGRTDLEQSYTIHRTLMLVMNALENAGASDACTNKRDG
jgi:hypothetical protein